MFCPLLVFAQKKQIATARDLLKAGKELNKAEKSMRTLLEDSANRTNTKIWVVLCDVLIKQYEQGNEKLYLKQKYDTAAFFSVTKRMYETMASSILLMPACIHQLQYVQSIEHAMHNCLTPFVRTCLMAVHTLFIQRIIKLLMNILIAI